MSYDPNSIEAQKGALGEKIVKDMWKSAGWTLEKPADTFESGASIVDFVCSKGGMPCCALEVKTQIAHPYGVEKALCYAFPKSRIEAYKTYSQSQGLFLTLSVVDPASGFIYEFAGLNGVTEHLIDGRRYPFDKFIKKFGGVFRHFHQNQADSKTPILPDALAELRKLYGIEGDDKSGKISEELKAYLIEYCTRIGHPAQFPTESLNKLATLEKECGTTNVINAICIEDDIYFDGVLTFLTSDPDEGTFDYIEEFARNPETMTSDTALEQAETKQEETTSAKSLVEKLAAFVNIGKADLTQSILDLRQKKFDREQAQMKELLL